MVDTTLVEKFAAEYSVLVDALQQLKNLEPPRAAEGIQGLEAWFREFQQSLRTISMMPDAECLKEFAEDVDAALSRIGGAVPPPPPPEEEGLLPTALPDGTAENDMLRWDHTKKAWVILDAPDADFKKLGREADDTLAHGWVRAH